MFQREVCMRPSSWASIVGEEPSEGESSLYSVYRGGAM